MSTKLTLPGDYTAWLADLKRRIHGARQRALLAANEEQIRLYHHIGRDLLARREREGWGARVIDRLSADLREEFPDMKGLSTRNLKYMRYFAEVCPELQFGQQSAARLPWFHIVTLITKVQTTELRAWYADRAIAEGWSRDRLAAQIARQLHLAQGTAVSNFAQRLPAAEAAAAQAVLKDPYHFDFLGLGEEAQERDIERALVQHVTHVLLELGVGFAFVGRQYRLEVGGDEFFIDLLFYHIPMKCYVVVELKAGDFTPGQAGQLSFYLAALDAQLKTADERPTIGLLLCRRHNRMVAEYALSRIDGPIGVAGYELVRALPARLVGKLPSIEELEEELAAGLEGEGGLTQRHSGTEGGER
jgi:predicted nuclease of restriction endonuclease-like (RecB) superfamily